MSLDIEDVHILAKSMEAVLNKHTLTPKDLIRLLPAWKNVITVTENHIRERQVKDTMEKLKLEINKDNESKND